MIPPGPGPLGEELNQQNELEISPDSILFWGYTCPPRVADLDQELMEHQSDRIPTCFAAGWRRMASGCSVQCLHLSAGVPALGSTAGLPARGGEANQFRTSFFLMGLIHFFIKNKPGYHQLPMPVCVSCRIGLISNVNGPCWKAPGLNECLGGSATSIRVPCQ